MKQALVIYSLVAGLKNRSRSEHIIMERLLALGYRVDLIYLDPDFEKEVENFDLPNISLVVAAGGDGTVKVAARTIITFKMKADLGIIPMGSANVIAAALNIPQKFDEALQVVEKYKKIVKIDVGVVNDEHYFLIGLSLGYISKVVTSTTREIKNKYGLIGYFLNLVFNKIKMRRHRFFIHFANGEAVVKGNSLVVFNALDYYGVKPKKPVNLQDGILNLYVFTSKTFLSLLTSFFYILWYHQPPRYITSIDSTRFHIDMDCGVKSCQIDGDYIRLSKPIDIEIKSQILPVITR